MDTGGCFCGAVRYELSGKAELQLFCFCADCRKLGGTDGYAGYMVLDENFTHTQGNPTQRMIASVQKTDGETNWQTRILPSKEGQIFFDAIYYRQHLLLIGRNIDLRSQYFEIISACFSICSANSRVGAKINPLGFIPWANFTFISNGSKYAAVFPVPVCAIPRISCPFNANGMACF